MFGYLYELCMESIHNVKKEKVCPTRRRPIMDTYYIGYFYKCIGCKLQVARTWGPQIDELKAMLAYVVIQPNFNVKRYR